MSANAPRARDVGHAHRIWRFALPEQSTLSGEMSATPLVLDGRVYVQSLRSNVYALDAGTGKLRWKLRFDRASGGPNGLGAGYGRLYGATDTNIFALDRRSGRVLWTRRVIDDGQLVDIAPAVARGLVFAGTTSQRAGSTGSLLAFDAATGRPRWRFETVRGGFADPRLASGGGVWWTPTVDRDGGLWVGTANPLPWGGSPALPNGAAYRGPARYTDSLLALGASDGRVIAWNRRTRERAWSTAVGVHRNDTGPLPRRPVSVCPGLLGVLTPMALAGGRVFVPVVDLCMQERGRLRAVHRRRLPAPRSRRARRAGRGDRHPPLDAPLWSVREPAGSDACPAVAGNLLVVPAGAEPSSIPTPTAVVDGYSLGPAPNP